jgi:membrane protease subunit HflC
MRHNDTRMVLQPDSEFFRYFVDPSGKMPPTAGPSSGSAPSANSSPNPAPPR